MRYRKIQRRAFYFWILFKKISWIPRLRFSHHIGSQFALKISLSILRDCVLSSPTLAPTLPERPSQKQRESSLTASAPGRTLPLLLVQMRYGFLWSMWVWRRRTYRRPCCPPLSNPPTSSWTVRPDGSRRWDNRMAAQHMPRDLVRPSSGQQKLAQTTKKVFFSLLKVFPLG